MNDHERRKLAYLLDQLPEDNLGVDMCLQHVTGQEILNKPWYTVERPSHANTPRVLRFAAIGTLMVTGAAFVTATVVPTILYAIPAYLGYVAVTLSIRQMRLASV
jgi:uncharacterized BrkB/YihY/UPF0761 family membrane protein